MKPHCPPARRALAASCLALAFAGLGGCATVAQPTARDPWEPFNRSMYGFNEGLDRVLLKPTATLYRDTVPPLVRTGVSNFFGNLGDAWSAVNSLLQLHLQDAEESAVRFQLNTMFGVFGVFDLASDLNIERHHEDFGQTLGRWGMPSGPYLVLPFFGPSTLRDAAALPVDKHYELLRQFEPVGLRNSAYGLQAVDKRANLLRAGSVLDEAALDKYSFTRDAYLQHRRAEIFDHPNDRGVPPALPGDNDGRLPEVEDEPAAPAAAPTSPASAPAGQPQAQPAR